MTTNQQCLMRLRRVNEDSIIAHAVDRPVNKTMLYRLMAEHYQQYQDQKYLALMMEQWLIRQRAVKSLATAKRG